MKTASGGGVFNYFYVTLHSSGSPGMFALNPQNSPIAMGLIK